MLFVACETVAPVATCLVRAPTADCAVSVPEPAADASPGEQSP